MENQATEQQLQAWMADPITKGQIKLLVTVMKLAGWNPEEAKPPIVGGENGTKGGVSVQDVAKATGLTVKTIQRYMRDFDHEGFRITQWRHQTGPGSCTGLSLDELTFLIWQIDGRGIRDPRKRLALRALHDMAGEVHRQIAALPEVKEATRRFFQSAGVPMYQQDEEGNWVKVEPAPRMDN